MDIPKEKLIPIIVVLIIVIVILGSLAAGKSNKEKELKENTAANTNYDEQLTNIINSIEKNNSIIVKSNNQVVTYEPEETENLDFEKEIQNQTN